MAEDLGDPFADWPDRTTLPSPSGEVTLVYSASESAEGVPWADGVFVPESVPAARAVAAALTAMPGWLVSTADAALAAGLLAAGAAQRRHAHSMSSPLSAPVPLPDGPAGLRVEPLSPAQVARHADRLGAVQARAYPPGHADAVDGGELAAVSQLRAKARGEVLGPMTAQSRIALLAGAVVGACLVVDRPGRPPHGGPWVLDVFRDPQAPARGVGAALLASSMRAAHDTGLPGLSLVVSHDNEQARRLYLDLGFVDVLESWTLALPQRTTSRETRP